MDGRRPHAHADRGPSLAAAAGAVRRALGAVRWYVRALMGDDAYDVYLARHARTHPGHEPLSLKEFWKQRIDDRERNPTMRCC